MRIQFQTLKNKLKNRRLAWMAGAQVSEENIISMLGTETVMKAAAIKQDPWEMWMENW